MSLLPPEHSLLSPHALNIALALFAVSLLIALCVFLSWLRIRRRAGELALVAREMAADAGTVPSPSVRDGFFGIEAALGDLGAAIRSLKAGRDFAEGVLDGMREGILLLDPDGRVLRMNLAFREMSLAGASAVGRPFAEAVRHADLAAFLSRARLGPEPSAEEIDCVGLKPQRLLVRASRLSGPFPGFLAVFTDVTELRRLETVRRDFVANVSHELRTPVTAIRSAVETLTTGAASDPEASAQFFEILERNAGRLDRLLKDLLDLARIESKAFQPRLQDLELGPAAAQAVERFRAAAEKKRIRLFSAVPEAGLSVRADPGALDQVLDNLIDNAIKYGAEGGEVSVRASSEREKVRVLVKDTGAGIEEKHLERLFERFYRVDAGRSRAAGGTGLGLSIVKHLVEAMGGDVGVESEPGVGSIFSFRLPRVDG